MKTNETMQIYEIQLKPMKSNEETNEPYWNQIFINIR